MLHSNIAYNLQTMSKLVSTFIMSPTDITLVKPEMAKNETQEWDTLFAIWIYVMNKVILYDIDLFIHWYKGWRANYH